MRIFNYHPDSADLVAESVADPDPLSPGMWLIPAHATPVEPMDTVPDGKVQRFDAVSSLWYLADVPQPEPEPVPPTAEQLRRGEIITALATIDQKSIRALREGDAARIATLEAQAAALRAELAALVL